MLRGVTAGFTGRTVVLARSACLLSVTVPRADRRARVAFVGEVARGESAAAALVVVDASMSVLVWVFPTSGLSWVRFLIELIEGRGLRPGLAAEVEVPRVAGRRA